MTGWPRHALALAVLVALSLGLYGRLYSPLDHAYPQGEAASAAITRFVAESPNLWGWNPTVRGGEPTQTTVRSAFHYGASLLAKFGNEPVYAHRLAAVTMALAIPLALYFLMIAFGMSWLGALATAIGLIALSPFSTRLSNLPLRLQFLVEQGDATYLAGITLAICALALIWRAAHRRDAWSLFVAALAIALTMVTSSQAAFMLAISIGALELAMLGIAGEYRFSHRRVLGASLWAYLLSAFWLGHEMASVPPRFWFGVCLGALVIRLLFLGRRDPWFSFVTLSAWAFGYLLNLRGSWHNQIMFEVFLFLLLATCAILCFRQSYPAYRAGSLIFVALLLFARVEIQQPYWVFPVPNTDVNYALTFERPDRYRPYLNRVELIKNRFREWRGDWGLRPPSQSAEFKLARWFAENPPQGRVLAPPLLHARLRAWTPFATYAEIKDPGDDRGIEFWVAGTSPPKQLPVAFSTADYSIYRVPFRSLARTIKQGKEGPPLELTWITNSHIRISGKVLEGHLVEVSVSYHSAWQSSLPISQSENGFMTMAPPPGPVDLHLEYKGTSKQHTFGYLSAFAWVASLGYVAFRSRRA